MNWIKQWRVKRLLARMYIDAGKLCQEGYEFTQDALIIQATVQKIRREKNY